ncbi:MAG: diadenylate cyclase CdaA [Brevinematia bacterium]
MDLNVLKTYFVSIVEICVIWFLVYKTFDFLNRSKAKLIISGLLVFVVIGIISKLLGFEVISWFFDSVISYSVIILAIVFREEIRYILLEVGSLKMLNRKDRVRIIYAKELKELLEAINEMSQNKIGAILVFERNVPLGEYIDTGIPMNSPITKERIVSIFNKGSIFHDGATIIRGLEIVAVGCVLPIGPDPSEFYGGKLSKRLGTRHRAGFGISRETDAISIIISEETGKVSIAMDYYFNYDVDLKVVENVIKEYFEEFAR